MTYESLPLKCDVCGGIAFHFGEDEVKLCAIKCKICGRYGHVIIEDDDENESSFIYWECDE